MFEQNTFYDKVVLVTGGGSGIGYSIAKQFITLGARVIIAGRKPEKLELAQKELSQLGNCDSFVLDIRNLENVAGAVEYIKAGYGRLDILINNAGGQFPSSAENISTNGWNAVINNNLNGTWYMTQAMALAFFIPQKSGCIINIIANVFRGFPGMAHTGAARAGVDNLTKSLAVEWAPYNIRINSIAPGIIASSGLHQYPDEFKDRMEGSIPVRRLGTVEEVAYPTLFLASDMASYITGETMYVDGGQKLWGSMWIVP